MSLFSIISAPLRNHAKQCTLPISGENELDAGKYRNEVLQGGIQETYRIEKHTVPTPDGALLSAFSFRHKLGTPETRTALLFNPNCATIRDMPYRWLLDEAALGQSPINFVVFDYRTTDRSTGELYYASDLLIDADAMLQFIENKFQTNKDKIALYGWSLGGAIAANAAHLQPRSKAPVILERTFSMSSKVAIHGLSIPEKIGQLFLSLILRCIDWELETVSPTKKMLEAGRPVLIIHHPLDPVMQKAASLYESLKGQNSFCELSLKETFSWINPHVAPLSKAEAGTVLKFLLC